MSYTHLIKTELIFNRVLKQLKTGKTTIEIYIQYKKNKQKCGRKSIQLSLDEIDYINEKVR